jgi:PAS domain S-box-containing protein
MTVFIVLGVVLPMAVVSAVVVEAFVAGGWVADFWGAWHRRTLTGICGAVVLTPLLVQFAIGGAAAIRTAPRLRRLEFALLTLAVLALVLPALRGEHDLASQYALLFGPLLPLLWAAVRFGLGGLAAQLLIVALAVLTATKAGYGPFMAASAAEQVVSVQAFLLTVSVPLLLLAALVAERSRSGEALKERLAFEGLVSELSAALINPAPAGADEALENALHKTLVAMGFDRCSVFQYDRQRRSCRITHSAESAGYPAVRRELHKAELPWLLGQLQAGVTVAMGDVNRDLPAEATAERRYLKHYGSRACVSVPVTVGDHVVRAVSFHGLQPRDCSADLVSRLQLLAEIFISALTSSQARAALRENEERLRLALAAGRMGAWDWDRRRNTVTWSEEHFAIMGFAPFSVVPGQDVWASRVHPEDRPRADAALSEAIAARKQYHCEYRVIWPDGTQHWVEARAEPIYGAGGDCVRVMGLVVDVTERKRAEGALRASEEQYRAVFNASADGLTLRDGAFRVVDVNPALLAMTGVTREEALGSDRMLFTPPEDEAGTRATFRRELDGEATHYEMDAVRKDGTRFAVEVRGVPLQYRGEPHVFVIARDITARKRAEAALQASEERYRAVVESQTELVCRYLPDTTLTFVNEAYCRFFGRQREALIGRRFIELVPESARETVLAHVASLVADPRAHAYDHEVTAADGSVRWQQWVDTAIFAQDGRVAELQGIGRDITDRKRAEEINQKLAHVSRLAAMGELTASIAHEINQPLGAILSNADAAELLLESGAGRLYDVRRILADIRKDDLRASEVVRRIRELLRTRELERHPLDLNGVAAGVLQLLGSDAARRGIAVETELAPDLPAVQGDAVHLQQVLLNLLLNGMEAMADTPGARRRLAVRTARVDGVVEVSVTDAGPGIAAPQLPRLFESFYTTKKDGMGLGLSIARSIVEAHGGRIWAENAPGRGAIFRFTVPAEPAA